MSDKYFVVVGTMDNLSFFFLIKKMINYFLRMTSYSINSTVI